MNQQWQQWAQGMLVQARAELARSREDVNGPNRAAVVGSDISTNLQLFHGVQDYQRQAVAPNAPNMYVHKAPICFLTANGKQRFLEKMDRNPYMFNRYGRQVRKVEGLDTVENVAVEVRAARMDRRRRGLPQFEAYVYWVVRPEIVPAPQNINSSNGYEVELTPQLWINSTPGFPAANRLRIFSHDAQIGLQRCTISTQPELKVFDYFRPWIFGTDSRFRDISIVAQNRYIEVAGVNTLNNNTISLMTPGWSKLREVQEFAEHFFDGDCGIFLGVPMGGIVQDYRWRQLE